MNQKNSKSKPWTNWFEIPVSDMDRAKKFYETIFNTQIVVRDLGALEMGFFPNSEVGCALCKNEWYKPGEEGTLVYMNAGPDLQAVQDRIENAGGKVIMPKKQISPEYGYMALFIDSEGNRMALHSEK